MPRGQYLTDRRLRLDAVVFLTCQGFSYRARREAATSCAGGLLPSTRSLASCVMLPTLRRAMPSGDDLTCGMRSTSWSLHDCTRRQLRMGRALTFVLA